MNWERIEGNWKTKTREKKHRHHNRKALRKALGLMPTCFLICRARNSMSGNCHEKHEQGASTCQISHGNRNSPTRHYDIDVLADGFVQCVGSIPNGDPRSGGIRGDDWRKVIADIIRCVWIYNDRS